MPLSSLRTGRGCGAAGVIGSINEPDAFSMTQSQRGSTTGSNTLATTGRGATNIQYIETRRLETIVHGDSSGGFKVDYKSDTK